MKNMYTGLVMTAIVMVTLAFTINLCQAGQTVHRHHVRVTTSTSSVSNGSAGAAGSASHVQTTTVRHRHRHVGRTSGCN